MADATDQHRWIRMERRRIEVARSQAAAGSGSYRRAQASPDTEGGRPEMCTDENPILSRGERPVAGSEPLSQDSGLT